MGREVLGIHPTGRREVALHVRQEDRHTHDLLPTRARVLQNRPHIRHHLMRLQHDVMRNDLARRIDHVPRCLLTPRPTRSACEILGRNVRSGSTIASRFQADRMLSAQSATVNRIVVGELWSARERRRTSRGDRSTLPRENSVGVQSKHHPGHTGQQNRVFLARLGLELLRREREHSRPRD